MNRKELLKKAIDTYGVESQIMIAMEEMAELMQALSKYRRYGVAGICNVMEEIADTKIMLDQLVLIFEPLANELCSDDYTIVFDENIKLDRLASFLGEVYEP